MSPRFAVVAAFAVVLAAHGCNLTNTQIESPSDVTACGKSCTHLRALGCPSAATTPKGQTCEDVCNGVQSSGIANEGLTCLVAAPTCAAADACLGAQVSAP